MLQYKSQLKYVVGSTVFCCSTKACAGKSNGSGTLECDLLKSMYQVISVKVHLGSVYCQHLKLFQNLKMT